MRVAGRVLIAGRVQPFFSYADGARERKGAAETSVYPRTALLCYAAFVLLCVLSRRRDGVARMCLCAALVYVCVVRGRMRLLARGLCAGLPLRKRQRR